MSEGVSEGVIERSSYNSKLRNEFERMNCKWFFSIIYIEIPRKKNQIIFFYQFTPRENFRKVEKRILDKLFSPEVYDNRMRPKGKPSKVKKALPHVHKCTEIDTFSVLCSANILVVSGSQQQYR